MSPELAERVMRLLREMDVPLGGLMDAARVLPEGAEKKKQEVLLGDLLQLQFDCMNAIAAEHPEWAVADDLRSRAEVGVSADARMDRADAEALVQSYEEFGEWFNRTTELTMAMSDAARARAIRRSIAEMLFSLDDAVRRPVRRNYPDLFSSDEP